MVHEICKDKMFLIQKAEMATQDDMGIAWNLLDSLAFYKDCCVGIAANMIGVNKCLIVFESRDCSAQN